MARGGVAWRGAVKCDVVCCAVVCDTCPCRNRLFTSLSSHGFLLGARCAPSTEPGTMLLSEPGHGDIPLRWISAVLDTPSACGALSPRSKTRTKWLRKPPRRRLADQPRPAIDTWRDREAGLLFNWRHRPTSCTGEVPTGVARKSLPLWPRGETGAFQRAEPPCQRRISTAATSAWRLDETKYHPNRHVEWCTDQLHPILHQPKT